MSATMTVAEARRRYDFISDRDGWHRQPVCTCGDYIAQHNEKPPHRCLLAIHGGGGRRSCSCKGYRYSRTGSGELPVPP